LPGSKGLAFVEDVAEMGAVLICDRAVIPNNNMITAAGSPGSLDAVDGAAQTPTRNAKGAADCGCRISRTAPQGTSHDDYFTFN
jgi:hypothetical protein